MTDEYIKNNNRRHTDTSFGLFISKYWQVIFGVSGIILTIYSGWLTTNNNTISIVGLKTDVTNMQTRITNVESAAAVKEFQFSEIIARLNKMENKIDTLTITNRR